MADRTGRHSSDGCAREGGGGVGVGGGGGGWGKAYDIPTPVFMPSVVWA